MAGIAIITEACIHEFDPQGNVLFSTTPTRSACSATGQQVLLLDGGIPPLGMVQIPPGGISKVRRCR